MSELEATTCPWFGQARWFLAIVLAVGASCCAAGRLLHVRVDLNGADNEPADTRS